MSRARPESRRCPDWTAWITRNGWCSGSRRRRAECVDAGPAALYISRPMKFVRALIWLSLVGLTVLTVWGVATNEYLWVIVSKGDNIPIAAMIPIVGYFTYLAMKEALRHDRLIRQGRREQVLD